MSVLVPESVYIEMTAEPLDPSHQLGVRVNLATNSVR